MICRCRPVEWLLPGGRRLGPDAAAGGHDDGQQQRTYLVRFLSPPVFISGRDHVMHDLFQGEPPAASVCAVTALG